MKPITIFGLLDNLRNDGWANVITGLGTARDKAASTVFERGSRLGEDTLEALYGENDMAARICDALPEDAAREGYEVKLGADRREQAQEAQSQLKDLQLLPKLTEAWIWGRVFGWGAVILGADDGARDAQLAEPLDLEKVQKFDHLNVIDRRHVAPLSWHDDPTQPSYGRPATYLVTPHAITSGPTSAASLAGRTRAAGQMAGTLEVHASRMIIFGGVRTPIQRRRLNEGFDDPLLQIVNTVFTQFGVSWY